MDTATIFVTHESSKMVSPPGLTQLYGSHDLGRLDFLVRDLAPDPDPSMADLPLPVLFPLRLALGHIGVGLRTIVTPLKAGRRASQGGHRKEKSESRLEHRGSISAISSC